MNDTVSDPTVESPSAAADPPDLDAIEADFDRVERALQELADGTYSAPADAPATDVDSTSDDPGDDAGNDAAD
ncbi:MAG: hypothetical protein AAGF91_07430 [Actinomycetota bacterium]